MPAQKQKEKDAEAQKIVEKYNLKTNDGVQRRIALRRSVFDLRTEGMRSHNKKGRLYCGVKCHEVGGLRVDEMLHGIKMAHLSCTDDTVERLVGSSPNSLAALEKAVGGENADVLTRLPLSRILKERFDLNLDCWIDESGLRKGRAVDTQGFIASNDEQIVLSYRFSTNMYDWMANLSMTSSEWEPEDDAKLGHAGVFSSLSGWGTKLCRPTQAKARVHTGYYNNFIYTIPMIRKHIIEPLLSESANKNAKPKKIYVVGCSLGAAISQIAFCFILEQLYPKLMDPDYKLVERLIAVNAGCPRIGDRRFCVMIMKKMNDLRDANLDRAVICRLVYNNDIVPHAPPNILTYHHLDKMVYITKHGKHVIVNPDMSNLFTRFNEIRAIYSIVLQKKKKEFGERRTELTNTMRERASLFNLTDTAKAAAQINMMEAPKEEDKTDFEKECESSPEAIHDHMPYWYMSYLEKLKKEQDALFNSEDRRETPTHHAEETEC